MHAPADLPIVDLSPNPVNDGLRRGLVETGFFYLRDHEIPSDLLAAMRAETAKFFSLPAEKKIQYEGFLRGYAALRAEHTEAGYGTGEYGEGDLCEKFTMGSIPTPADRASAPDYYDAADAQSFYAQNLFPNDAFAATWTDYFGHMQRLAARLMEAVRTTLALPKDAWVGRADRPADAMRYLNYPEITSDAPRMAAHYDDNLLTLLHQSETANGFDSLQVMLPGEIEWKSVPADDRYFVVNVGESLMYLTEGRAAATKHRVLNPPPAQVAGSARTSIAFFHLPNWNCPLRPLIPESMDHTIGQAAPDFDFDRLRDPDGTIPYYRLIRRASERGFTTK